MHVTFIFKGILAEMEGQIKSFRSQLESRDSTIAELVERISELDTSTNLQIST